MAIPACQTKTVLVSDALVGNIWTLVCYAYKMPSIPGKTDVERKMGHCHPVVRVRSVASESLMHACALTRVLGEPRPMFQSKVV